MKVFAKEEIINSFKSFFNNLSTLFGRENGLATLDDNGKVPLNQINDSIFNDHIQYADNLPANNNIKNIIYAVPHIDTIAENKETTTLDIIGSYTTMQSKDKYVVDSDIVLTLGKDTIRSMFVSGSTVSLYTGNFTGLLSYTIKIDEVKSWQIQQTTDHFDYFCGNETLKTLTKLANVEQVETWFIRKSEKGTPGGVAILNSNGKIPLNELSFNTLIFLGLSSNLTSDINSIEELTSGMFFIINAEHTYNEVKYYPGDWCIYDGTSWSRQANNNIVSSVNGQIGTVTIDGDNIDVTYENSTDTLNNTLPKLGKVKKVNGNGPDENGNIVVDIPTKTSQLTNDKGYITGIPSSMTIDSLTLNDTLKTYGKVTMSTNFSKSAGKEIMIGRRQSSDNGNLYAGTNTVIKGARLTLESDDDLNIKTKGTLEIYSPYFTHHGNSGETHIKSNSIYLGDDDSARISIHKYDGFKTVDIRSDGTTYLDGKQVHIGQDSGNEILIGNLYRSGELKLQTNGPIRIGASGEGDGDIDIGVYNADTESPDIRQANTNIGGNNIRMFTNGGDVTIDANSALIGKVNESITKQWTAATFIANNGFQLGGGSEITKGMSPTGIYVDTGSAGKWLERDNSSWAVQINAGTSFYIPVVTEGTITVTYYTQGTKTYDVNTNDMTTVSGQNGKFYKIDCTINDYIGTIKYSHATDFALKTLGKNVEVLGDLNVGGKIISSSIPTKTSQLNNDSGFLTSHQDISGKLDVSGSNGTSDGVSTLINKLTEGTSDPVDNDYYIAQYAGGGTTSTTYHRRPISKLWNYIKSKMRLLSGDKDNETHDCNSALTNGFYYYNSNGPSTSIGASATDGSLYVQRYNDTWVSQIAQDYRNGRLFVRGKNNGTWTSWIKVMNHGDNQIKIGDCTLQYNSTTKSLDFTFA